MATAETLKQELPPEGGYRPLNFERVPPKRIVTLGKIFTLWIVSKATWFYFDRKNRRMIFVSRVEDWSSFIACEPTIAAERDRAFLKHLRYNRDEEEELMKNYPGWVTGTYFGEPIFKTLPENMLWRPTVTEYYIHTRLKYQSEYIHANSLYH